MNQQHNIERVLESVRRQRLMSARLRPVIVKFRPRRKEPSGAAFVVIFAGAAVAMALLVNWMWSN